MLLPQIILPFSSSIAALASASVLKVAKPKPLPLFVTLSQGRDNSSGCNSAVKASRISCGVVLKFKFDKNILFFIELMISKF